MKEKAQKDSKINQLPKAQVIKSKGKVGGFNFVQISSVSSGYVKPHESLKALERAVKEHAFKGLEVEVNEQ